MVQNGFRCTVWCCFWRVSCKGAKHPRGPASGRVGRGLGKTKAGRGPAWERFSGVRRKANTKGGRMSAKDVVWTIVISAFVTCYVMWRVSSLIEVRAPSQTERGLCAERSEQEAEGD